MDARVLARETLIQAGSAKIVLSADWRTATKLEGISIDKSDGNRVIARGSARFELKNLTVEAREIEVRWMADHEDILVYAKDVAFFKQRRDQPYHTRDVSAVTMANDQVSFFK